MPPCVSSGTHTRRGKRLKKSMCDLERARPKRCVSIRSRKKVAVESKKNEKNMWFSTHAEFTSDFQVASAAMRFFRNASKKREKVREKAMYDLESERPKRCVEKCGSRVQKTKKNYVIFDVLKWTWNEILVSVFTVKHTDATLNVDQCAWLRLKTSHSQLNVYFCFIFIVVITKSIS